MNTTTSSSGFGSAWDAAFGHWTRAAASQSWSAMSAGGIVGSLLLMAGVCVDESRGVAATSDGDVPAHAVADARRRLAEAEEVGTQRGIARTRADSSGWFWLLLINTPAVHHVA